MSGKLCDRSKWRRTIHEGTKLIQEHSVNWGNVNRAGNWKSLIQCTKNLPRMNAGFGSQKIHINRHYCAGNNLTCKPVENIPFFFCHMITYEQA